MSQSLSYTVNEDRDIPSKVKQWLLPAIEQLEAENDRLHNSRVFTSNIPVIPDTFYKGSIQHWTCSCGKQLPVGSQCMH